MVILECSCLKMMIGRQFQKEREKLEQDEHFGQVLEISSGIEEEKYQSKKRIPRENSWYIVPACSPSYPTGADRAGI